MALFSFGDIKFKTSTRKGFGPVGNLLGGKYDYGILKYPIDLGNYDKGHYIVIHVNEQVKTQFESRAVNNGDLPTIYTNRLNSGTTTLGSSVSNITGAANDVTGGRLGQIVTAIKDYLPDTVDEQTFSVGFARTIRRTSDTIALYMPDTLNFIHNQAYSEYNLGGSAASALLTGGSSLVDAIKNNPNNVGEALKSAFRNISPFALGYLANQTDLTKVGFAAATGKVLNPMLELLFTSPAFREFRFDFMLYARSEEEAKEIHRILDRLRYHQAPEFNTLSNGFFMVPPSEFDIKFYYNGKENDNIPKISTCVLTSLDIDYAPNGFSAYEVPKVNVPSKGGTGMPVAIRLSLNFKETEYLTKANYAKPDDIVTPYNTIPGSQQSKMLQEQDSWFSN